MLAASDGGFFYLSYSPRAWPTPIRARCKLYLYYMVRVVIQNFLKKPVISTVFKADE